ncbi:mucin-21 [Drosophila bipectinata]|uniref:mucin-21 n=1 Tax=Drosophila bipectinata TaxID=42026 RepID=UPI001C89E371|nr:mucin-19 [Drosophila bipectinata]KAH8241460.1 hypothetical protein KR026_004059 [Drosophila bipectinata]
MMENTEAQQHLTGLPPLPKSLSAAAAAPVAVSVSASSHSRTASPASNVAALTAAAGELYLGPSTSSAARNRSYNGHNHSQRHGSLSSTQESLSDRESVHSRASSTHSAGAGHTPTNSSSSTGATSSTIDNQLAILRREMYGLRQLDLSLLSQLWALNESIQGFRVFLQEQDALSPPSRSRTPSDANSLSSDEEDDGSYAPVTGTKLMEAPGGPGPGAAGSRTIASPAASGGLPTKLATGSTTSHASTSSNSGTSGSSSAASSMGKHQQQQQQQQTGHYNQRPAPPPAPPAQHKAHPQLPRILQQRMRQAPPPPPPTRPKGSGGGGASTSSSNHSISSVTQPQSHPHQHPHSHAHHSRPV